MIGREVEAATGGAAMGWGRQNLEYRGVIEKGVLEENAKL